MYGRFYSLLICKIFDALKDWFEVEGLARGLEWDSLLSSININSSSSLWSILGPFLLLNCSKKLLLSGQAKLDRGSALGISK